MQTPDFILEITDPVKQLVARHIWSQFLYEMDQKRMFHARRNQNEMNRIADAASWTLQKKRTDLPGLLNELEEDYAAYGLDVPFYRLHLWDEELEGTYWEKFLSDWKAANLRKQEVLLQQEIDEKKENVIQRIRRTIITVPEYLRERKVDLDEFTQVWGTMSGRWNTIDFERMRTVVRVQNKYPILLKIANRMGRVADEESHIRLSVASGNVEHMQHSAKSDIRGITVGNDLNSLLPLELVQSSDQELDDLFLYKYVTHTLQNFSHRSEVLKPTRSLNIKPAKQKGPMIICLDTSGSMAGQPELIGQSMLIKLLNIADLQNRNIYLIAFSVSVNPIDMRKERARLQEFFTKTAIGDTDATKMMEKTFKLLDEKPDYMSADVLWISDFKMQLVKPHLLERMLQHRREGICFYGLRTGLAAEPLWEPYFDQIYDVAVPHFRKYGK